MCIKVTIKQKRQCDYTDDKQWVGTVAVEQNGMGQKISWVYGYNYVCVSIFLFMAYYIVSATSYGKLVN